MLWTYWAILLIWKAEKKPIKKMPRLKVKLLLYSHLLRVALINPTCTGNDNREPKTQTQTLTPVHVHTIGYSQHPKSESPLPVPCTCSSQMLLFATFALHDDRVTLLELILISCPPIGLLICCHWHLSITSGVCGTVSSGSLVTAPMLLTRWKRQEQVFTEKEGLSLMSVFQPFASCGPLCMQDFATTGCQWGMGVNTENSVVVLPLFGTSPFHTGGE